MIGGRLAEVAQACGGRLQGADAAFSGVSTDTRTLRAGQLFFALRGPRFDGHDLLDAATAAGAAGVVVEQTAASTTGAVVVADTRRALGLLANDWRRRFALPVLAVTGSAGKTTVKEMLAAILRTQGRVLATRGNLNNDIGVPLTLFELGPEHDFAVIEMGANRAHDIATLMAIAEPRVGVLTLCAPAHLEGFGDLDTVARTKGEIVSGLGADGVAVINADDAYAPLWRQLAAQRRVIGFGLAGEVRARDVHVLADATRFRLVSPAGEADVALLHRGMHNVANALAAAAAALALGVPLEAIARGLAAAAPVAGRLEFKRGRDGLNIIDDSYNANPASLGAAIDVLGSQPGARWLVLGDMAELGAEAREYHRAAGARAGAAGIERLFTLGELSREAHAGFGGSAVHCADAASLLAALEAALAAGNPAATTVLFKGSRVMALEKVAARLAGAEGAPC